MPGVQIPCPQIRGPAFCFDGQFAYLHGKVSHKKEWSYYDYRHDAVHHVNGVESFWRIFKQSIASTHIHVSQKYLQSYINEFAFRANRRAMAQGMGMFDLLIAAI